MLIKLNPAKIGTRQVKRKLMTEIDGYQSRKWRYPMILLTRGLSYSALLLDCKVVGIEESERSGGRRIGFSILQTEQGLVMIAWELVVLFLDH